MRRARAFGPASIGNVAAGFDVLGAALAPLDGGLWGDVVEIHEADRGALRCEGPFAHQLPELPAQNLALKACSAFERRWGRPLPPLELRLHKGLPVGSGLGSSSATVVATLRALDAFFDHPLDEAALLEAAGEAESVASGAVHLDNVAPALLGGLRLIDPGGAARELPFPGRLRFVLLSPELRLATRESRAALPREVPLRLAVAHAQNLASLVHGLHGSDLDLIRQCLRDLLAEPHRAALVPGFREVQAAAMAAGALGCSLSGAGPAVFAMALEDQAAAIGAAMQGAWRGIGTELRLCTLDRLGARVLAEVPCA